MDWILLRKLVLLEHLILPKRGGSEAFGPWGPFVCITTAIFSENINLSKIRNLVKVQPPVYNFWMFSKYLIL